MVAPLAAYLDLFGLGPSAPPTLGRAPVSPWAMPDSVAPGQTSMTDMQRALPNEFVQNAIALIGLLIDYLASNMNQGRDVGQLGGGTFRGAPQRTSWNPTTAGPASSSPSSAPTASAAPPASTSLPPGQGLQGLDVQVIGDSLMVGAKGRTEAALRGAGADSVSIDAAGGRALTGSGSQHHVSPSEIRAMAQASGADVLVLELGSNHGNYDRFVPETMAELDKLQPPPTVVWVNTQTERPSGASYGQSYYNDNAAINGVIAREAARRPNMHVADWSQIAGAPGINGGDGLHLSGAGNDAMAKLILDTISAAR